jgi:N-acetylmuramoyl-L-alanine amidase
MAQMVDPLTKKVFKLVTRPEWGARPPRWQNPLVRYDGCYSHHGVSRQQPAIAIWRGYQNWHMDGNGWPDIAYTYGYDDRGVIYEGRGFLIAGAHTFGFNETANGFCYIGDSDKVPPPPVAVEALYCLIRNAEAVHGKTGYVRDHREGGQISGSATSCPGQGLYGVAAKVAHQPQPQPTPTPPTPVNPKDDEMRFIVIEPRSYTDNRPKGPIWLCSGTWRRHLRHPEEVDSQKFLGAVEIKATSQGAARGVLRFLESFEDVAKR